MTSSSAVVTSKASRISRETFDSYIQTVPAKEATPFSLELDRRVDEGALGTLYEKLPDNQVRCYACAHRCLIKDGLRGICKVRYNRGGTLMVPRGYVGALQCDPIEKKPFFHAFPGTDALTFGMLGCDLHCSYCQNWVTSQALRDPGALTEPMDVSPEQLVEMAQRQGARVVATSYNEPLITSEWAVEVFKAARPRGFSTAYISNGNATREVLEYIRPWTDLYKIDLKSFRDKNYRSLGGKLENIVNGIRMVHEMGFWLEIVTLIIPGFNDSDEELGDIARFLSGISPSIPWHVTAFHKDYKMQDPDNTTPETLLRAARIGEEAGLQYIYAGNLPGRVGRYEDTRCPRCQSTLIRRIGYRILDDRLTGRGSCFNCQQQIPGVWRTTINAGRAN
jgi:pyruvate formate lyase activating enzyme